MNTEARTGRGGFLYVTVNEAAGQAAIERAKALLAGIPDGVDKAVRASMSRTVDRLRRESNRTIREKYDITDEGLRADKNVRVSYSYQNGVQATVTFSGHKIPLYRFGGSPKMPEVHRDRTVLAIIKGEEVWVHPSVQASGHQFRGTALSLLTKYGNDAFVQRMPGSGHVGIFARTGGMTSEDSEAIQELMGPSVAQMVGNQEVAEKLAGEAYRNFESELDKAVYRILTGWR